MPERSINGTLVKSYSNCEIKRFTNFIGEDEDSKYSTYLVQTK